MSCCAHCLLNVTTTFDDHFTFEQKLNQTKPNKHNTSLLVGVATRELSASNKEAKVASWLGSCCVKKEENSLKWINV